jgi:hypothetical protein
MTNRLENGGNMKNLLKISTILVLAVALCGAFTLSARADLTLTISDGVNTPLTFTTSGTSIAETDQTIGDWTITTAAGLTNSPGTAGLAFTDLDTLVNSGSTATTLALTLTAGGFTSPTGSATGSMSIGGTLAPGGTVSYTAKVNDTSFGPLNFSSSAFSGAQIINTNLPTSYSLTDYVEITQSQGGHSSFDATLDLVPLPATALLLGTGLLGLLGLGWRRRQINS